MSIQHILNTLGKLVEAQMNLLEISKQKTTFVKEGQIDKLQTVLIEERKAIQTVKQVEEKRIQEVNQWFIDHSMPEEEATITGMLENIQDQEAQHALENAATRLAETIVKLKQQEELNHVLFQQSMQFVQLSLELLNPSIGNLNYSNKKESTRVERSVFDSKA